MPALQLLLCSSTSLQLHFLGFSVKQLCSSSCWAFLTMVLCQSVGGLQCFCWVGVSGNWLHWSTQYSCWSFCIVADVPKLIHYIIIIIRSDRCRRKSLIHKTVNLRLCHYCCQIIRIVYVPCTFGNLQKISCTVNIFSDKSWLFFSCTGLPAIATAISTGILHQQFGTSKQ